MDFHTEFDRAMENFPSLGGLVFVDPDGESIIWKAREVEEFVVRLAGARMQINLYAYRDVGIEDQPTYMEMNFEAYYVLSMVLTQSYSITAIAADPKERGRLRQHLETMARKFNQEIV